MTEKSLKDMTGEIVKVFKDYEKTGTKPWTYEIAAKDLSYQVGSLTKLLMQKDNERFAKGLSQADIKEKISDELADILAEVLFVAHELDIDMDQAWSKMSASDKKKIETRSNK